VHERQRNARVIAPPTSFQRPNNQPAKSLAGFFTARGSEFGKKMDGKKITDLEIGWPFIFLPSIFLPTKIRDQ